MSVILEARSPTSPDLPLYLEVSGRLPLGDVLFEVRSPSGWLVCAVALSPEAARQLGVVSDSLARFVAQRLREGGAA